MANPRASDKTSDQKPPETPDAGSSPEDSAAGGTPPHRPCNRPRPRGDRRIVWAYPCPNGPRHITRVYKTEGKVRYCCCDDCGATWKKSGEHADPLREFADELATSLEAAEPVVIEEGQPAVILLDQHMARETAKRLRELVDG